MTRMSTMPPIMTGVLTSAQLKGTEDSSGLAESLGVSESSISDALDSPGSFMLPKVAV